MHTLAGHFIIPLKCFYSNESHAKETIDKVRNWLYSKVCTNDVFFSKRCDIYCKQVMGYAVRRTVIVFPTSCTSALAPSSGAVMVWVVYWTSPVSLAICVSARLERCGNSKGYVGNLHTSSKKEGPMYTSSSFLVH